LDQGRYRRWVTVTNLAFVVAGLLMIMLATAASSTWAHDHFLPTWRWSWQFQLRFLLVLRCIVAVIGFALIAVLRPLLVRSIESGRGRETLIAGTMAAFAVAASLVTVEAILASSGWRSAHEKWGPKEPLNVSDPIRGWTLAPSHEGSAVINGRTVHYATNAQGYRVRARGDRTDFAKPTIIFAGESILLGYGLEWQDSIPAQVQAISGVQTANLSVEAYATDQSYLRLRQEISRFAHPVAIVLLFMPKLLDRNLDVDRPHLDEHLHWQHAEPPALKIVELTRRITRYRSVSAIQRGIAMTQAAFQATFELARTHHAQALIVVPEFLPEDPSEREIRREVLDSRHLPYVLVQIDPSWRIPADLHPDPRAANAIAQMISANLNNVTNPSRRS
jgi:hypothetical protein